MEFPIALFGVFEFELFGYAEEGPVEVCGREVDAAAVGVGVGMVEAVGAGADDALEDDEGAHVWGGGGRGVWVLEFVEGGEFIAAEGGFEAVGEADAVGVEVVGGGGGDDADGTRGVDGPAVGAADVGAGDDLGAEGEDEVWGGHVQIPVCGGKA